MENIIPLIMAGGAGTGLWPASREGLPKQFLPLLGKSSTFRQTLERVSDPTIFARPIVITNEAYRFIVLEQLLEAGLQADLLLEPARRDSGPAIVAGALFANGKGDDAVVLALSADHIIPDTAAFVSACKEALPGALQDFIVTFGIRPDAARTEYGYLLSGELIGPALRSVEQFVEKPDAATAAEHVKAGCLWNSGNFLFRASVLIEEYRKIDSETVQNVSESVAASANDLGFIKLEPASFQAAKSNSIDCAVMERTARAAVLPVSFEWADVGSWQAVWERSINDAEGNSTTGPAVFDRSRNCYVSTDRAVVALEGVDDLVVIATQDAVLVSKKEAVGSFKQLISKMKSVAPQVTQSHLKVHRPWGSYQPVDNGERHQVKRIIVKPGQRLSLQRHHHRSEHWIVVRGAARVTVNDTVKIVHENESIYIPIGAVHRLENPGKIALELIEVQTGSYLGEDDIVRLEDDYQRT